MAHTVSRRPLTAEARVRSRLHPFGICGGQSGTGTSFFPEYFGFPLSISFHRCSITRKKRKKLIIFITGLHNKPQGCGASVASAAGPFTTEQKCIIHISATLTQQTKYTVTQGCSNSGWLNCVRFARKIWSSSSTWRFSDNCFDESDWIYETQKKLRVSAVRCHLIYAFYLKKMTSPKCCSCRAVHSCNCDHKLTVTSQQTFVSGSNFDSDLPFRPLTWRCLELNCN
jgi:hypothetical protein